MTGSPEGASIDARIHPARAVRARTRTPPLNANARSRGLLPRVRVDGAVMRKGCIAGFSHHILEKRLSRPTVSASGRGTLPA